METPDDWLRAAALHASLARDVERAVGAGFSIQDTVAEHKALTGELLDRLPAGEEKQFIDVYGTLVNRCFRPTGGDYQRVAAGLVEPTDSRRGIRVDERLRAAPRVFVGGPLLAGNLNGCLRIWHLESCRRIFAMSADVAAEITAELRESAAATGAASTLG